MYSPAIGPQQDLRRLIYHSNNRWIGHFTTLPTANTSTSSDHSAAVRETRARDVIWRAASESSLNAMMSSRAEFQEMCRAKGKGLAYSLSWRVMARQNAERKLLMGYTSIFNAFFLVFSVFCCGRVRKEVPYFTAIQVIILVSGTVAQWECVWGTGHPQGCSMRRENKTYWRGGDAISVHNHDQHVSLDHRDLEYFLIKRWKDEVSHTLTWKHTLLPNHKELFVSTFQFLEAQPSCSRWDWE